MAKIDKYKELVNSHSTEEVLEWLEAAFKRCQRSCVGDNVSEGFSLGYVSASLTEISNVISALNEKLRGPKSKVL